MFVKMKSIQILFFATFLLSYTYAAIRVDQRQGFSFCSDGPQMAQLVSVEVDGQGCSRWPCLIQPGRSGRFKITLYNPHDSPIRELQSDIHGNLRITGLPGVNGKQRVAMPGEVKRPACQFAEPECPIHPHSYFSIVKEVTVPKEARMIRGTMVVEMRVRDGRGRTLTCFKAPVKIN